MKNIFVTAPSDSISNYGDKLRFDNAIIKLNNKGVNVKVGKTVSIENKFDENEYKLKVFELEQAIIDDNIDLIISANGGERLFEIIPYLDFQKLKNLKPKIFQGFSDNSILTFLFSTVLDWNIIYAPCFPTFGYNNWDETIENNFKILNGENIIQKSCNMYENKSFKKVPGKELEGYNLDTLNLITELNNIEQFKVQGQMIGGCLDVLKNILDTKYSNIEEFNNKGNKIWYIENCAMQHDELRECIRKMKDKKWFDKVVCFMIGRGKITLDKEFNKKQNELLKEELNEYNVPIITSCDFGHVRPFITIINGVDTTLEYKNNSYTLEYNNLFKERIL